MVKAKGLSGLEFDGSSKRIDFGLQSRRIVGVKRVECLNKGFQKNAKNFNTGRNQLPQLTLRRNPLITENNSIYPESRDNLILEFKPSDLISSSAYDFTKFYLPLTSEYEVDEKNAFSSTSIQILPVQPESTIDRVTVENSASSTIDVSDSEVLKLLCPDGNASESNLNESVIPLPSRSISSSDHISEIESNVVTTQSKLNLDSLIPLDIRKCSSESLSLITDVQVDSDSRNDILLEKESNISNDQLRFAESLISFQTISSSLERSATITASQSPTTFTDSISSLISRPIVEVDCCNQFMKDIAEVSADPIETTYSHSFEPKTSNFLKLSCEERAERYGQEPPKINFGEWRVKRDEYLKKFMSTPYVPSKDTPSTTTPLLKFRSLKDVAYVTNVERLFIKR